jgi:hypothetical protein
MASLFKVMRDLRNRWELRDWEFDIKWYMTYKRMHDTAVAEGVKRHCLKRMQEIKAKYPNHQKAFE